MQQQFTRNFALGEFLKTNKPIKLSPTNEEIENMRELSMYLLQPIREYVDESIEITENGGFRGNGLNIVCGGSKTSDHIEGKASDVKSKRFTKIELFNKALEAISRKNLSFKQIILELDSNCLHLSYDKANNKCEILVRETINKERIYKRISLEKGITFSGNFSSLS